MAGMLKFAVLSAVIVGVAFYLNTTFNAEDPERVALTLQGLLDSEDPVPRRNVAVGFGACEDAIVFDSTYLLGLLGMSPGELEHHDAVGSPLELEEVFAFFFSQGIAAERYVSDKKLFSELVSKSRTLAKEKVRFSLGGNAPVMGNRFAMEGQRVLLGGKIGANLRPFVHEDIRVAGGISDTVSADDVHLILEYRRKDKWGSLSSPRANRLALHSDTGNAQIDSLEAFAGEFFDYQADLLVISGFQIMDGYPFSVEERQNRLSELRKFLRKVPKNIPIHIELASFVNTNFIDELVEFVLPYVDSVGANEQELPTLYDALRHSDSSKKSTTNASHFLPSVSSVMGMMHHLLAEFGRRAEGATEESHRVLSRIHTHTLAFQIIAQEKDSLWRYPKSAAAKASLVATRHTCGDHAIDPTKTKLLAERSFSVSVKEGEQIVLETDPLHPVDCWEDRVGRDRLVEFCVAPVLVCRSPVQTVGGGDNISAAALAANLK